MNEQEQMSEALDLIHDIAVKLATEDGLSNEAIMGLDQIIALARYKFNVVPEKAVGT